MKKINLKIILISAVMFSCSDFKKSIQDTLKNNDSLSTAHIDNRVTMDYPETISDHDDQEKEIPFTSQIDKLEEAEKQLRTLPQFIGKSIFVYKLVHFYSDGRIITKLQNPSNPKYIDSYIYENGKWQEPKPVVLQKNEPVEKNLMNLDRLPFKNVSNVYHVLSEKRKEIGSTASDYTIYAFTQNNKVNWYPNDVGNDRSIYLIEFNENGTLQSFDQQ